MGYPGTPIHHVPKKGQIFTALEQSLNNKKK